jgi:hypothetical protein
MPILTERRKFVRYLLPYEMLYVFDHFSARVGRVRDVGMGGLSCEFNHESDDECISGVIDIFSYDKDFYLPLINCKRSYSLYTKGRQSRLRPTRCGQHFVALKGQQKDRWQELIEKLPKLSDSFASVHDPFA